MTRRVLVSCALLALAPAVLAQGPIKLAQTVTGELTAADKALADGSLYDEWTFSCTEAGGEVVILMKATEFDPYLHLGRYTGADMFDSLGTDDDGGGERNARFAIEIPQPGDYVIRANALEKGMMGPYSLELSGTCSATVTDPNLTSGNAIESKLGGIDPKTDGRFYEDWYFAARAGERIVITMEAADVAVLDPFLELYRGRGATGEPLATDDDGGGRTNARIEVTVPATGEYTIRATTAYAEKLGAYSIRVSPPRDALIPDPRSLIPDPTSPIPDPRSPIYRRLMR